MNILFFSHLLAEPEAGPSWSVPARVEAQSKRDNVLWVNTSPQSLPHWESIKTFYHVDEEKFDLSILQSPFNSPDVVVFEGLYDSFLEIKLSRRLRKDGIPYIIVPRGSLTFQAMHNKSRLKKSLAHLFFYDRYVKGAAAIQYLTEREYNDSKYRFDGPHFIIPNGYNTPTRFKSDFSENKIKAIFIGRFDAYHKGLDILVDACIERQDCLREGHFELSLFGTKTKDWYIIKNKINSSKIQDIISINGPINGLEKENAILESDLFVMTSRFEGHPMGLIEALAYGLPCLITDGTNMRDVVSNADAGWTCETNKKSIGEVLIKTISESGLLESKGKNAKLIAEKYRWDVLAEEFHHQINKTLKK